MTCATREIQMYSRFRSVLTKFRSVIQPKFAFNSARSLGTKEIVSDSDYFDEILTSDQEYQEFVQEHFKIDHGKNCYIIQPYVKWGPQKKQDITPEEQLSEAKALINTLPSWTVEDTVAIPLENLDSKTLFKSGSMDKLKNNISKKGNIDTVFVNLGNLKKAQTLNLEKALGVSIMDRYRVVMQILKIHATSKHAKLQVALAELYYLQRISVTEGNFSKGSREKVKLMFQAREQKLKGAIKDLRSQRALLRNNRQKNNYPIIAVVGYTNAGKTSLIKALTGEDGLTPRNQLFATLDVTMHAGLMPSGLEVLYVDTVGFISDIPTNLIECFVATLEDAILADVILHVEDISSPCFEFKRKHVLKTLQDLGTKAAASNILEKIVCVGNKCDLAPQDQDFGILKVSSTTETGLDALRIILEKRILTSTNRVKIKIRVPSGGDEVRWLYKNSTVISETVDEKSSEFVIASVIITHGKLQQFKHHFSP